MILNECKRLIVTGSVIPVNSENVADVLAIVTETVRLLDEENFFSSSSAASKAAKTIYGLMITELAPDSWVFELSCSEALSQLVYSIPKLNLGYTLLNMDIDEFRKVLAIVPSIKQLGENAVDELFTIYNGLMK